MTSKRFVIPTAIVSAMISTLFSANIFANDCVLFAKAKESARCLQDKVVKLEKELAQSKKLHLMLPKGAVIEFNASTCPSGWQTYMPAPNGIVTMKSGNNLIKCEKL